MEVLSVWNIWNVCTVSTISLTETAFPALYSDLSSLENGSLRLASPGFGTLEGLHWSRPKGESSSYLAKVISFYRRMCSKQGCERICLIQSRDIVRNYPAGRRTMRLLSEFKPPQPNRAMIWLCEFLLPLYVNVVENLNFKFLEGANHPWKFLKDKSAVIVMNHSDRQDPLVLLALAKHVREPFYCVVAREVFDWNYGTLGWLFQKLGCYSVNRGVADFKSIHTTHNILTSDHGKLAIFPESEITGDEESIHEFSRSFIHLLLESQEAVAKCDAKRSIWVLPVGVSYKLETSLEKSVSKTLSKIERHLCITHKGNSEIKMRVADAMDAVLQCLSESYKYSFPEKQSQHERVRLLARHICERMGEYTHLEHEKPLSEEQLLYLLRNHVLEELAAKKNTSVYAQKLSVDLAKIYGEFLLDLDRVERLLIVHRILKNRSSPIQICRILDFLEAETCGPMSKKGRQCASIFVGKPIEVLPHLASYKACKDAAIDELNDCIHNQLQAALDSSHQGPHLVSESCSSNASNSSQQTMCKKSESV